jgi:Rps23 Pro-64 3,4-dihydroxylase Tpa1-like proline 4-hydroxylase
MTNNLNEYIVVIKNALTHPLCDAILNEFKSSDEWQDTVVGTGEIQKNIRNCETIVVSYSDVIQKNKKIRLKLDKYIFLSAGKCIQEYNNKFPYCHIEEDSGYELLKYPEGCFYTQHVDSFKARPRAVSCSFILNDDFEGGEFAFFDRELKYKLEKGDAIMFPSNFMYPHEIMPVTKGTRYSVITWFV